MGVEWRGAGCPEGGMGAGTKARVDEPVVALLRGTEGVADRARCEAGAGDALPARRGSVPAGGFAAGGVCGYAHASGVPLNPRRLSGLKSGGRGRFFWFLLSSRARVPVVRAGRPAARKSRSRGRARAIDP